MNTTKVTGAVALAELGYRVFPCQSDGKAPITEHGFKDATSEIEQIHKWWSTAWQANIGLSAAGMVIVDVDGADNDWPTDAAAKADLGRAGAIAETPRGGRHYFFRRPTGSNWRCSVNMLAKGVDLRTDGGYVVVAPSATKDGEYRWVKPLAAGRESLPPPPGWLAKAIEDSQAERPAVANLNGDGNTIREGQRDNTLARIAGSLRRVGLTAAEIGAAIHQVNRARCVPPLADKDVDRIASSIARYEPDSVQVALIEDHFNADRNGDTEEPAAKSTPLDPGEFPEHLLRPPGFLSEFIDHCDATAIRKQPVLALGNALALLGAITGRKVRDPRNTRTNIYAIGVAESGAGKDLSRDRAKELLFLAGATKYLGPESLASAPGLVAAVEVQPAVLLQIDEFGKFFRSLGDVMKNPYLANIVTVLMKLFTSSSGIYIGDAYADAKKNKVIHQPHACLWATTTPDQLYNSLTTEHVIDGFMGRLMIFEAAAVTPPRQRRPSLDTWPQSTIDFVLAWSDHSPSGNLQSQHPEPTIVRVSDQAEIEFDCLDEVAETQSLLHGKRLGVLWTRAVEKARKLALLYACSQSVDNPVVDAAAAQWGCAVAKYTSEKLVSIVSKWVSENPYDAKRKRVLRIIAGAGAEGITKNNLCQSSRWLQTRERTEIIQALALCGDIVEREIRNAGEAGRPTIRYIATECLA